MPHRLAYIKGGDVVMALQECLSRKEKIVFGNHTFLDTVQRIAGDQPLLVMSAFRRSRRLRLGKVEARTIAARKPLRLLGLENQQMLVSMIRHLVGFRPDRIICGGLGGALHACTLVANFLRIPLVVSLHNALCFEDDIRRGLMADAIVCHGPFLRAQVLELGYDERRLFEFENDYSSFGADRNLDSPVADLTDDGRYPLIILFVGRGEVEKGVIDLFEAFEGLSSHSNVRLVYIGDGAGIDALKRCTDKHRMAQSVLFLGQVEHELIPALMRQSNAVVTPTRREFPEGRCMATIEALTLGIPVVAPNFGPFPYVVQSGINGVLYEPNSVAGLRSAMAQVLADAESNKRLVAGACDSCQTILRPARTYEQAMGDALALIDG